MLSVTLCALRLTGNSTLWEWFYSDQLMSCNIQAKALRRHEAQH
jgi:hypothetical protein